MIIVLEGRERKRERESAWGLDGLFPNRNRIVSFLMTSLSPKTSVLVVRDILPVVSRFSPCQNSNKITTTNNSTLDIHMTPPLTLSFFSYRDPLNST